MEMTELSLLMNILQINENFFQQAFKDEQDHLRPQ
jgi:hypothetical protein